MCEIHEPTDDEMRDFDREPEAPMSTIKIKITKAPMLCAHCGHTHQDEHGEIDIDFCRECDCRDFDH